MSEMLPTMDERADAYLDGDLPRDEALAFERDLARRPEVAEALAAALALRELLGSLPPLAPPAGLAGRIAGALPLAHGARKRVPGVRPSSPARAVLSGLGFTFRGTAVAALGLAAPAASASSGLAQVRWVLGPFGAPSAPSEPEPRRPLWRRLLSGKGAV
jgi:anti-sigma factor RsiW